VPTNVKPVKNSLTIVSFAVQIVRTHQVVVVHSLIMTTVTTVNYVLINVFPVMKKQLNVPHVHLTEFLSLNVNAQLVTTIYKYLNVKLVHLNAQFVLPMILANIVTRTSISI
jgi:hypothetical protein